MNGNSHLFVLYRATGALRCIIILLDIILTIITKHIDGSNGVLRTPPGPVSFIFMQFWGKSLVKQECIPVGCVLPAAVAVGGLHQAPPSLGTRHPLGPGTPPPETRHTSPWDQAPPGTRHPPDQAPPPVDRHMPVNISPCPKLRLRAVIIGFCSKLRSWRPHPSGKSCIRHWLT